MAKDKKHLAEQVGIWLPLLLAVVLVLGMLVGLRLQPSGPVVMSRPSDAATRPIAGHGQVEELIRYIEAKYVDDVDRDLLVRDAIERILKDLDPHSNYIPAEDLAMVNEQLEGNFDGIGVEFMFLEDTIVVVTPLAGGPSEAAGIRAGDKIITVEDSIVAGQKLASQDIINLLRGESGTQVEIGIRRNNADELMEFTVTRDKIPMHSVDIAQLVNEQTAYIKINRFSATTYDEFVQALEELVEKQGAKDLIIDLRHNPGGYLQQATKMLSQLFTTKGDLLVYTEGRTTKRSDYKTNGRPFYAIEDVVVLIDEGSASASEIVAGAIQDHDRGVIVGRRSFGKGLVQEQYPLRDGSALRLTVARYYTPSGRSIQKDYADQDEYDLDVTHRLENGELSSEKKINIADTTRYYTAGGHVVFGGGGIVPDVFVPLDTLLLNERYLDWRQHIPSFVFRYAEENGNAIAKQGLEEFVSIYQVPDELYRSFLSYAREKGVANEEAPTYRIEQELRRFLKARLARQYYGDDGFYAVWNRDDEMLQQALRILNHPNPLAFARK